MTDLARYNPFRGLTRFNPFGRDMDDLPTGPFPTPMSLNPMADLHMPIDITEDDKVYKVRAEMPGFNKEDISVSVNGDQVTISAETKKEKEEKKNGEKIVHRECYCGRQFRSFTLPQAADETNTKARYEDGVLNLELPKKAGDNQKKITVN